MARSREPFADAVKKAHTGKHWRRPDAVAVITKLNESGLTVAAFIREHRLPEKRVRWWKSRLGPACAQPTSLPEFVSLQVVETKDLLRRVAPLPRAPTAQGTPSLEVVVNNGRMVRVPVGFDPGTLSQIVEVLEVTPC